MLKYTEGDLSIKGVKIHYYRTGGPKPPVVLLHGMTDNGLCWTPLAEWLAVSHDVIMPDAQGHGKSDRLAVSSGSRSQGEQIAGLIQQLKLTKPLVMGHSMGAGMAVDLAVNYPEIAGALVLEDPAWQPPVPTPLPPEIKKMREDVARTNLAYLKMTREEILADGRKLHPLWSQDELIPWSLSKTQFDPEMFKNPLTIHPDYRDLVPKINCPTLLIIAESGIITPDVARQAAKLWKSQYPFKWVQIMGAGHNIRREQFEQYKDVVQQYIDSLGK